MGRGSEAGLVLDDTGVSRAHARIDPGLQGFTIFDLGSRNGLFVNGDRVQERVLRDGDRIQLGTGTVLKFRLQEPAEEEAQRRLYESAPRCLTAPTTAVSSRDVGSTCPLPTTGRPLSVLILDLDPSIRDIAGPLAVDRRSRMRLPRATRLVEDALSARRRDSWPCAHAGRRRPSRWPLSAGSGVRMTFGGHRFGVTARSARRFDPSAHDASALLGAADAGALRAQREVRTAWSRPPARSRDRRYRHSRPAAPNPKLQASDLVARV